MRTLLAFVLFTLAPLASGAVSTAKYLMSFHTCSLATVDCSNPGNHYTYIVESNDGATWSLLTGFATAQGSVPDIIRRGNKLYVYTPGKITRYNMETNAWETAVNVSIKHVNGNTENFVDPSPIFDENGYIVLFYLASGNNGDPAKCASSESSCTKIFRSATEVPGSDGSRFTVDSGNRAEITLDATSSLKAASDPDIFAGATGYVLLISRGQSVQALTSSTLKGSYGNASGLSGGILGDNVGGIPAGHYDPDTARYWIYVTTNQASGTQVVRRAVTTSLNSALTQSSFSTVVSGAGVPGMAVTPVVASPGFLVNVAGTVFAGVSGTSSGSSTNLTVSATVTIATGDLGKQGNFYAVALYGGNLYASNGSSWVALTGGYLPVFSTTSAYGSSHTLTILNGVNVVGLKGAEIYVGYGTSLNDLLDNAKYGLIYTVP